MTFYRVDKIGPLTVKGELARILALGFNPFMAESVARLNDNAERADELVTIGDASGYETRVSLVLATEPTEAGLQYVLPGCERDKSRGPAQADLF